MKTHQILNSNQEIEKTESEIQKHRLNSSFFQTKMKKLIDSSDREKIYDFLEFRKKGLRLIQDNKLEFLKETLNEHTVLFKTEVRTRMAHLSVTALKNLEKEISNQYTDFIGYVEEQFEKMQKIKSEKLKLRIEKQIMSGLERLEESIEMVMSEYLAVSGEKVKIR